MQRSRLATIDRSKCTGVLGCVYLQGGVILIYTYSSFLAFPCHILGLFFFLTSSDFFPHKFYKAERCGTEMDTHTHCTLVCVCMMLAHFYLSSRCLLLLLSQQQQNFAASSAPCFFFIFYYSSSLRGPLREPKTKKKKKRVHTTIPTAFFFFFFFFFFFGRAVYPQQHRNSFVLSFSCTHTR